MDAVTPPGHWNTGTMFSVCTAGTFSKGGKGVTSCQTCLENQFQSGNGKTGCQDCPEGKYSGASAVECQTCASITDSRACAGLSSEFQCLFCKFQLFTI